LALTTLQLAEQQLGAGTFERHRQSIVLAHRVLRRMGGSLYVALDSFRFLAHPFSACCGLIAVEKLLTTAVDGLVLTGSGAAAAIFRDCSLIAALNVTP
jgi:hypothetical protein